MLVITRMSLPAYRVRCLLAFSLLATPLPVLAQTAPSTELASLLAKLTANIDALNRSLPSLFCTERIVTEMHPAPTGNGDLRETTESIFRIRRADDPPDPNEPTGPNNITRNNPLQESRVITRINGAPNNNPHATLDSPFEVFGLFSGGLTRVSTDGIACFHYHLHPGRNESAHIVISYESWEPRVRPASCPYTERVTGEATIDSVAMQVIRLENTTFDQQGTWNWVISYAPVSLGGHTFWLPATIKSSNASQQEMLGLPPLRRPFRATIVHTLTATYSDYHLRSVSSHIVPDAGSH